MDLGNVDTKEAFVLVWLAMKYVIKSTDFLPTLGKAYCEIDIALWSQHITQWQLNFIGTIWNSNCQRHTTEQQNWMHGLVAYLNSFFPYKIATSIKTSLLSETWNFAAIKSALLGAKMGTSHHAKSRSNFLELNSSGTSGCSQHLRRFSLWVSIQFCNPL